MSLKRCSHEWVYYRGLPFRWAGPHLSQPPDFNLADHCACPLCTLWGIRNIFLGFYLPLNRTWVCKQIVWVHDDKIFRTPASQRIANNIVNKMPQKCRHIHFHPIGQRQAKKHKRNGGFVQRFRNGNGKKFYVTSNVTAYDILFKYTNWGSCEEIQLIKCTCKNDGYPVVS